MSAYILNDVGSLDGDAEVARSTALFLGGSTGCIRLQHFRYGCQTDDIWKIHGGKKLSRMPRVPKLLGFGNMQDVRKNDEQQVRCQRKTWCENPAMHLDL
jgi:hypothetical protein